MNFIDKKMYINIISLFYKRFELPTYQIYAFIAMGHFFEEHIFDQDLWSSLDFSNIDEFAKLKNNIVTRYRYEVFMLRYFIIVVRQKRS